MTFKKDFKQQMVPEWEKEYMDYECLKKILKEVKSSKKAKDRDNKHLQHKFSLERAFSGIHLQHGSNHQNDEGIGEQVIEVKTLEIDVDGSKELFETKLNEERGEAEARFLQKLDEELNKVNAFYKEQVEAVKHEATLLSKQVETLVALRVKVKNLDPGLQQIRLSGEDNMYQNHRQKDPTVDSEVDPVQQTNRSTHHEEEAHSNYNRRDPMEILEHVKIDDALQSPISTVKNVFTDSNDNNQLSFNKEELKKVEKQLRLVFVEFYQKLLHLKDYSFMNLSAFSKIMKKYEKNASRGASREYMRVVDNSYLGTSDEVNFLLEKVESTFIRNFSHSNHKKGRKLLRPKMKRERNRITFFTGFFSGCLVSLIAATILRIVSQQLMEKKVGTFYMENIFPLYSLFGYITLHMLMYAANTYFWRRYRINYPFLFGIRPGTELDHREVFLLTTGHAVVAVLCFLINLQLEMNQPNRSYKTAAELVPLSLIVLVILITFCPFNIIYRSSRFFFIRSLFRCICAPFFTVTLMDFFLADQLTSQFQSFRSFVLYICYYGLGEHSRRENKCRSRGIYNVQYFVVGVIPYWFRLAQCMRQLYDERDIDHAINGSKYLSTIIAMVIRTTFETKKAMTWKVWALISSAVAILLNIYWDIVKDWSLLQRHSKNPYLRDKLIVSHKSVYYIAMVLNIVLRISWMQLVLELHWKPLHRVAIITLISCLEIIRRGIWNFFRLENEHLNNVGNYRAFKSVPHPFSYHDDDGNDKDE
ncbi:putative SPX domain-containing protein [Medicago truncatula]|uniref:Putative SPX domain-containing protein n=1 Tax=Medicago truncatula TaxID=3880 RepID=A0A396HU25_MEDTR|nr:phosphate transporter PHO1 homolog 10 [Medicago truncatula]XP_039690273.1 phosphate transporter PHO1 homolog 10 [Medicago truncatula]RHN55444.1 putative SPX domain-containing protein [Medicago truncatula]